MTTTQNKGTPIQTGSINKKIVAPDLLREREKRAFDQEELTAMLWGDAELHTKHKRMIEIMNKHPKELGNNFAFREMSISEQQTDMWRKIRFIQENYHELILDKPIFEYPYWAWIEYAQGKQLFTGLHYSLFSAIINVMADEEQHKHWMPQLLGHKVLGAYAQTELGHGSDVAGLETTATFDQKTDEFIIHSPTITSAKYWPGEMGRYTTHAVVMARLLIGKKDYGVHPFIVQLRDRNTFKHLTGVQTGDLGPKFSFHNKDNGWATFDQVRIPRRQMMMKMTHVSREGKVKVAGGDPRVMYTSMMLIRTRIIGEMHQRMLEGLTIALRYAVVRRQFATIDKSKVERQIIDYQTLQHQLTPILARAYVMGISSNFTLKEYAVMMQEVEKGKFSRMDSMHHLLSGCKGIFTNEAWESLDIVRRSAGGAGYQAQSGLTEVLDNCSPNPTFEGENTVMILQSSRYLLKLFQQGQAGKKLPFPYEYVSHIDQLLSLKDRVVSVADLLDIKVLEEALAVRSAIQVRDTAHAIAASRAPAAVRDNELFSQQKVDMVKAHINYTMFHIYLQQVESHPWQDLRIKPILLDLARIAALSYLKESNGPVFDAGYFSAGVTKLINEALEVMVAKVRPQLIPLVEAKTFEDVQIASNIGNYYGDIYEKQLELAKGSALNVMDAKAGGVPPQWEKYMKPFLHEDVPKYGIKQNSAQNKAKL